MKGLTKSLEAVIGIIMIMFTFLFLYSGQETLPEFETINWRIIGFNSLQSIDAANDLRFDVLKNDTSSIKNKLTPLIPSNLNYDLQICTVNCSALSIDAEKITSVSYLIAGEVGNFTNREVVLYIWSTE